MNREFMPGDPKQRKKWITVFSALIPTLMAFRIFAVPRIEAWLLNMGREKALPILTTALSVTLLALVPAGIYMLRVGFRILRATRYPLESMKVMRDTKVLRGAAARRVACVVMAIGALLSIMSLVGAWQAYFVLPKILMNN